MLVAVTVLSLSCDCPQLKLQEKKAQTAVQTNSVQLMKMGTDQFYTVSLVKPTFVGVHVQESDGVCAAPLLLQTIAR